MAIKFLSDIDVTGNYNLQASDIPDLSATYATVAWVTTQNFLTTLPAHNHDDRYYTKSQADNKYLLIGGETDPVFVAHAAYGVTAQKITNWDSAFGWGDHSGAGYLLKPDADSYYQPIGNYDNYSSWNLKTNSVQRTTVTSGGTLNLVAGTNVTVAYSAGGTVTISSSVPSEYLTQTEGDARYLQSLPAHTHPIEEVDGLQDILDTKADVGHTHSYLPLAGGTLTSGLTIDTTGTALSITGNTTVDGSDVSIYLGNSPSAYGFYITYVGSGTGNTNAFRIQSTNGGTPKTLLVSNQDGIVNFPNGLQYNGSTVASQPWVAAQNYLTAVPAGYATETYVTNAVSALVDSAPGTLNTLNELAAALGDDPNFATTITTAIGGKADAAHTHAIGDIDGLQNELDGKQPAGSYAASTHTHSASDITSGTLADARLPSQTSTLLQFNNSINVRSAGDGILNLIQTDAGVTAGVKEGGWNYIQFFDGQSDRQGYIGIDSDGDIRISAEVPSRYIQFDNTIAAPSANINGVVYAGSGNSNNWNTAYGWGNHASAGYLTSIPTPTSGAWWNGGYIRVLSDGVMEVGKYLDFHVSNTGTSDFDVRVTAGAGTLSVGGVLYAVGGNSGEWNTAYGWGNHATAGYGSAGDTAKGVEAFGWGNHADAGYLTSVTNISGNAATATKLATARTISLSGDASGSATFDGSANATISVTVADDSHNHTTLSALGDYVWNNADNGRTFPRGIQTSFVSASQGYPDYGSVMRIATYSGLNDGGTAQLYFPYSTTYGGDTIKYKLGQYNNGGWSQWYNVASREWVTAQNYLTSLPAHTHTFASLTSKPTTLSGYGITDAATSGQGTKADTAYGWGDHAQAGYITQVQGDTLYQPIGNYADAAHTHAYLPLAGGTLTGDLRFNQGGGYGRVAYVDNYHGMVLRGYPNNATGSITVGDVTSLVQYSGDFRFYRTNGSINELYFQVNSTAAYHRGNQIWDTSDFSSTNVSNWNTAYGWGNHASAGYATPADITTAINNLVDSAPGALNTLNELAAAIGDDANFATTITNSIATKVSLSGEVSLSGMKKFETNVSSQDDWQNSPISILERDGIGSGSASDIYAPNLNFHWRNRVARSLWMAYNGDLHYGEYSGAGVPGDSGTFYVGGGNSSQWNTAYSWGNHATAGYGSAGDTAKGVEAFGWGNHAGLYASSSHNHDGVYSSVSHNHDTSYLPMSYGNVDMENYDKDKNLLMGRNVGSWPDGVTKPAGTHNGFGIFQVTTHVDGYATQLGFDTNQNSIWVRSANPGTWGSWVKLWGENHFSSSDISSWNTAYGWGNHASAGYATQAWVTAQGFASATGNATQAWVTANYQPLGSYAASTHQHDASAIVSGQFATELIPDLSGTYSLSSHTHSISDISDRTRLFNNMGSNHSTYQNFNDVSNFGPYFVQNTAGGPGTGSSQFYGLALGLGNDYAYGSYAMQMAIPRYEENDKYLSFRTREGGTWSGWVKFSAGYADSAGSASTATSATSAATWTTARTITIGNTGKSVNGSGNVSWSLAEIGAAAASHTHSYLPLGGGTLTGTLTGVDIQPSADRTYSLGAADRRWQIVFCETLDSAGLHEANLASDTTGFHATGTVLVWKNGEAIPCTEFADHMKIGIAVYGNASPLVQGAEPVLCTGQVNEGDYLVTSQVEGHAVAMSRKEVKDQDIMECVIGKALESGSGDSHLIKTWVNI